MQVDDRLQDMRQVRDELLALERQCLEALDRGSTWQVQHAIGHGDSLAQVLEQFSMDLQVKAGSRQLHEVSVSSPWTYRCSQAQDSSIPEEADATNSHPGAIGSALAQHW